MVYVIRTRRIPFFKSRPSKSMLLVPTGMTLIGAILPWTGLAHLFGSTPLPAKFFLILFGMVVLYLLLCNWRRVSSTVPPMPGLPDSPLLMPSA